MSLISHLQFTSSFKHGQILQNNWKSVQIVVTLGHILRSIISSKNLKAVTCCGSAGLIIFTCPKWVQYERAISISAIVRLSRTGGYDIDIQCLTYCSA
jgi:hypothetical protein